MCRIIITNLLNLNCRMSKQLQECHFNLKFASKQLERNAKSCKKQEGVEKSKLKKAIEQGNTDGARIHAENAIRKKSEYANYLTMSSRIAGVASRVQTAIMMKNVTKDMGGVVKGLDAAAKSMNLEKMQKLMDKFEKQFEDMDVQSKAMDETMGNTVTAMIPQESVDNLMQEVADEHGLEVGVELGGHSVPSSSVGTTSQGQQEQDELSQRLARLRQQ